MTFDDVPEEAWISRVMALEERVTALENHRKLCDHPRVEEDWVFNGDDEVRVYTCMVCGESV
jgi:hypothetical protein